MLLRILLAGSLVQTTPQPLLLRDFPITLLSGHLQGLPATELMNGSSDLIEPALKRARLTEVASRQALVSPDFPASQLQLLHV
eukprot:Skav200320  [mRNA]  locus=scaffold1760:31032:31561:- [translate_table: standard]